MENVFEAADQENVFEGAEMENVLEVADAENAIVFACMERCLRMPLWIISLRLLNKKMFSSFLLWIMLRRLMKWKMKLLL